MIAERYGIRPWEMRRLTRREIDLIAAEFDRPGSEPVNEDLDADDMPVPDALRGLVDA